MKKIIIIMLVFLSIKTNAQVEQKDTIKKNIIKTDTIKTEVIDVVTSYTPKVTDAEKIKRIPEIEFSDNTNKKKLEYPFKNNPVASTFVSKGVQMKVIKQEDKERIFKNYAKGGFGNSVTPYIDISLQNNSAFNYDYGLRLNGVYSKNFMEEKDLSSTYFNSKLDLFYKKEGNYIDWLVRSEFTFDGYNWFGIPNKTINFDKKVITEIDQKSAQRYNGYDFSGQVDFDELYIENVKGNIGLFHDYFLNKEVTLGGSSLFIFPLKKYKDFQPEDVNIKTSLNSIFGGFENGYDIIDKGEKHQFVSFGVNPYYEWVFKRLKSKVGFETTIARDLANSKTLYLIRPDVHFSLSLSQNNTSSIYLGAKGGIKPNSYKELSRENPFMSPTHAILPTNEKYNAYLGIKGMVSNFNYNFSSNYSSEESKVMFVANKSKSNGIETIDLLTNQSYRAYEYGNSFGLAYDDIKTLSFNTEIEYVVDGRLNLGIVGNYNIYTMDKMEHALNLPELKADFFAKYHTHKWFSGINLYYLGNRKDMQYKASGLPESIDVDGYISLNIDAGYHINDYLSLFAKGTNLTNNSYEQFTNYQAQGLLVIAGIIFKFDKIKSSKKARHIISY